MSTKCECKDLITDPYFQEWFEFVKFLGKGRYGEVCMARHKTDGEVYAVKSIRAVEVEEAKMMSKLNHKHVVRYHNSWTGDTNLSTESESSSHSSGLSVEDNPQGDQEVDNSLEEEIDLLRKKSDSSESSSDVVDFISPEDSSQHIKGDACHSNNFATVSGLIRKCCISEACLKLLYIQMEYCEGKTLKKAINKDLCRSADEKWRLFGEIVEGLEYIHSNGIIHRDLNPSNIFLHKGCIKIGDLGMAKILGIEVSGEKIESETNNLYGTYPYVAPELWESCRPSIAYDNKVDMYSLGMILFEMMYKMNTRMERKKVFDKIREFEPSCTCFPEDFVIESFEGSIVKSCVDHDPGKRYAAEDLLAMLQGRAFVSMEPTEEEMQLKLPVQATRELSIDSNRILEPTPEPERSIDNIVHVGIFAHATDQSISSSLKQKLLAKGLTVLEYNKASNPGLSHLEKCFWFVEKCLCILWVATKTSIEDAHMKHYHTVAFGNALDTQNNYDVLSFFVYLSEENQNLQLPKTMKSYDPFKDDESLPARVCDIVNKIKRGRSL